MKIVQLTAIDEAVPPHKYGGTERVVYNVCEGLVKQGHDVYLLGTGDSITSAKLVPIVDKSLRNKYTIDEIDEWRPFYNYYNVARALELIKKIKPDIVHNHIGWSFVQFEKMVDCPVFTTIHGPMSYLPERETFKLFPETRLVSISNNQRKAMPDQNWIKTVYNGIEVEKFKVGYGEGDYFAFLGRISPEKGVAEICKMIRTTNHKLIIGAKLDSQDRKYFEEEVKPYIDGEQIKFLGELDHEEKNELLRNAKAALSWLNWEEPFGLFVPEANACGTPVIVNKRGSMREIVEEGKNGFLVNTIDEMREKLDLVHTISREECRKYVEKRFSVQKMVSDYTKLSEILIEEHKQEIETAKRYFSVKNITEELKNSKTKF
jgi:glycosyltransferase involved in cell wall biosynthesis